MNIQNLSRLAAVITCLVLCGTAQANYYRAELSGPAEAPPNTSLGTGYANVYHDPVARTLKIAAFFTGLEGLTTAAHIHAPTLTPGAGTAGVATQTPSFAGFPLGVTEGSFNNTFDLTEASSWRAGYITANGGDPAGAEAAFVTALQEGRAYFNVHSTVYPGGEIRGFLTNVPDASATAPLLALGVIALLAGTRFSPNLSINPTAAGN